MDKRFLGILAALVVIFGVIFAISQNSSSNGGSGSAGAGQVTNHVEGQNTKNVTLVEYGDYECPICGAYYQPLKDALTPSLLQQIHFQFRNLPLTSIHPNAFAGARAAEAAGMQNKYWQMHDQLYENQDPNGSSGWVASHDPLDNYFVTFAKSIGLNVNQFKQDYQSDKVDASINADLSAFKKTGKEQATPTFFLDNQYVANTSFTDPSTNEPSAAKITQVIQNAINKKH